MKDLLLALVVIIAAAQCMGALFRRIGQPPVIGEVLAGILLGPSVLGSTSPVTTGYLFPPAVVGQLSTVAQLGVVLFMFVVGVELDTRVIRQQARSIFLVSTASIVVPFLLGAALSIYLYPRLSSSAVPFPAFMLFLGVSMSVTAFPVLARILKDRGCHKSRLGAISLACAAINDIAAWCMLAFVVGVVNARLGGATMTAIFAIVYIAFVVFVVRPVVRKAVAWYERSGGNGHALMAASAIGLLVSSLATDWIGIHALFGAFIFGAVFPHDSKAAHALAGRINDFVVVVLLPAFFALTGLRTEVGLVAGQYWLITALIILVAFLGKFGGAALAARSAGMSWRDAGGLGILMNTRGLMELIVLSVGLDLGVISPRLFAMLILMAIVTTCMTGPILDRVIRPDWRSEVASA